MLPFSSLSFWKKIVFARASSSSLMDGVASVSRWPVHLIFSPSSFLSVPPLRPLGARVGFLDIRSRQKMRVREAERINLRCAATNNRSRGR